jgi:hypothetical protein
MLMVEWNFIYQLPSYLIFTVAVYRARPLSGTRACVSYQKNR